jgi:hypothetical protein
MTTARRAAPGDDQGRLARLPSVVPGGPGVAPGRVALEGGIGAG